jgi:hypothetical protein
MEELLQQINPAYFWDVNIDLLDENKSKKLIIERVFSLGSLHEIDLIHNFYGKETVVMMLKSMAYIDPKTLNYISIKYNVPKSRFKCHRRKQSMRGFWD